MVERSTSNVSLLRQAPFPRAPRTAASWWIVALLVAATPTLAADAPTDADLTEESGDATSRAAGDTGTGKTLQERIRAVSRRSFLKANRFELTPVAGFSADDPFFRSWTVGARGAWHFSEEFALDFGGAGAVFQEQQDIFRALNVEPDEISEEIKNRLANDSLLAYIDAGVIFSPFYGKVALASEFVSHFDVFVSAGAAAIIDSAPSVSPGLQLGGGARFFFSRFLAARVDVRNYVYASNFAGPIAINNLLMLNFGLALYFPLDFDYSAETLGAKD